MAHSIAKKDYVEFDGVDISNDCNGVHPNLTKDQVDASGFSSTGKRTLLAGQETNEVTLDLFWTPTVHGLIYQAYQGETAVDFVWRPDVNNAVGPNNPELRGTVNVFNYPPEAVYGEVRRFSVTLSAADEGGLVFYET